MFRLYKAGIGKCLMTAAGMCLVLPGCGSTFHSSVTQVERDSAELTSSIEKFGARRWIQPNGTQISERVFVAAEPERTGDAPSLPKHLQRSNSIYLVGAESLGLLELLSRLAGITGVPHVLMLGPDETVAGPGSARSTSSADARPGNPASENSSVHATSVIPNYKGPLSSVLDEISSQFDLEWSYNQKRIVLREFVLRQYQVSVLPSRVEFSGSVGSANSSAKVDLPEEVRSALKVIAGASEILNYAESSGIISVVARPKDHVRIADYVRQLNDSLDRQVAFDVNVLTVTLNRSQSHGLDLDLIIGEQGNDSIGWSGGHAVAEASGTVNARVVAGAVSLSAIVTALDRKGDVSVETRIGATTSNNRMVPIQVVRETAYARTVEAVPDAQGNTRTTIEPGTVTSGFEIYLLPRVLNSGEILVRYTIKMSDLNDLAEFTSDRQTIQLPKVSTTSFEQEAVLGNGQTLVLAGFERERRSVDRSGFLAGLFGGKSAAVLERISTVLLIRPRILSRPAKQIAEHPRIFAPSQGGSG